MFDYSFLSIPSLSNKHILSIIIKAKKIKLNWLSLKEVYRLTSVNVITDMVDYIEVDRTCNFFLLLEQFYFFMFNCISSSLFVWCCFSIQPKQKHINMISNLHENPLRLVLENTELKFILFCLSIFCYVVIHIQHACV